MPKLKKIILSFLASLVLFTSFLPFLATNVHAQTTSGSAGVWYNQSMPTWYSRVYGSPPSDVFGERYTAAQVDWIIWSLITWLPTKIMGGDLLYCALQSPGVIGTFVPGGRGVEMNVCIAQKKIFGEVPPELLKQNLAAKENKNIVQLIFEDRPLSGITYFKNIARNWHLIPEAKAQTTGFGFSALDPILPIWRASRNMAYGVLVLAVLILSFMIMFRVKINPQTAISVQSAIPKVVIALILITFSYAIAGFMVDLMYVVIGFISFVFSSAYGGLGMGAGWTSTSSFFDLMTKGPSLGPATFGIFGGLLIYAILFGFSLVIGLIGSLGSASFVAAAAALFPPIGYLYFLLAILIMFVLFIVFLFISFKIFWMLLKAFASVILLVIVAPIQITLGVVISSMGFGSWLKVLISNLAVFPLVGIFFALSYLFLFLAIQQSASNIIPSPILSAFGISSTLPPVTTQPGWPPLLFAAPAMLPLIYLGTSLVLLTMLPKVSELIQALITGKPFTAGTAIGEALGPIVPAGRAGLALRVGSIEEQGAAAAAAAGVQYTSPGWIQALRTIGVIRK